MKHLMRTKLASISLIAALAIVFTGSLWLKIHFAKMNVRRYLSVHQQAIDANGKNGFPIFDPAFYRNRIFLVGEEHAIRDTYAVAFSLLTHIKKKTNFRYYLDELPYSSALDYNRYLETGDESILKRAFNDAKGTFGWNRERFAFYQNIFRLNQTLAPADRIRILGLDIEHEYWCGIDYLCEILNHCGYQKGQNRLLDDLLLLAGQAQKAKEKVEPLIKSIVLDLVDQTVFYNQVLEEKFFDFRHVIVNILNKLECDRQPSADFNRFRDEKMLRNFVLLYSHLNLKNEAFFGVWGRDHVYQAPYAGIRFFAHWLKKSDLNLSDKIVSISIFYRNCQSLTPCFYGLCSCPAGQLYCVRNVYDKVKTMEQMAEVSGNGATLFRLDAPASPYSRSLHLFFPIYLFYNQGATTEFFQYAILIKDSPAASPLES